VPLVRGIVPPSLDGLVEVYDVRPTNSREHLRERLACFGFRVAPDRFPRTSTRDRRRPGNIIVSLMCAHTGLTEVEGVPRDALSPGPGLSHKARGQQMGVCQPLDNPLSHVPDVGEV
jgi:hypothetical protein